MGWAEQLPSGRYRAVWRNKQGQKRSRSAFHTKEDAERYAGAQEDDEYSGRTGYQGRSITWGEWLPQWQQLRSVEASTLNSEKWRISKYLQPAWGDRQLVKIKRADVQAWVAALKKDMAPASVEKVFRILASSMQAAVDHDHIAVNPCTRIKLPTVPPPAERFLTRGEVDEVLKYLNEPYRTAVILLVGTGLRFGEMAGLHWQRVDLYRASIAVADTWDDDGHRIKSYPKSKRIRHVPIPSWVIEAIGMPSEATTCGLEHARGSVCRSGLVVPAPQGGPLSDRNLRNRHFYPALRKAGVGEARLHDLRHTYASWLLQGGASLSQVAEVMGHSTITVTQRYAHLAHDHANQVRNILESV